MAGRTWTNRRGEARRRLQRRPGRPAAARRSRRLLADRRDGGQTGPGTGRSARSAPVQPPPPGRVTVTAPRSPGPHLVGSADHLAWQPTPRLSSAHCAVWLGSPAAGKARGTPARSPSRLGPCRCRTPTWRPAHGHAAALARALHGSLCDTPPAACRWTRPLSGHRLCRDRPEFSEMPPRQFMV